jgi:hypothetical protein
VIANWLQRLPRHLGGKGNRWAWFTGDELSDIHNALLHAQDGTGTAPGIIEEIRAEWKRIDA